MPKVNPNILIWARESAGYSQEEAATKLGLSDADKLDALETGEKEPTRRQLLLMSEKYRRPLLTFYLPKPPQPSKKGEDFRTLPEEQAEGAEPLLDALLRDVFARQGLIRAAFDEVEENEPLPFVGSARIQDRPERLVASMREVLGVDLQEFRGQKTSTDAFAVLRSGAEKAGIFVLLMGNLGTFHTDIDTRSFRGFALADPVAPFVVINEKDSRAAWSFTLLHELAHIWLGETGISGYAGEAQIERFCDQVAARYLLDPAELELIGVRRAQSRDDLKQRISEFANARNLSRKMVAYNLLRVGGIPAATYRALSDDFDAERIAHKAEKGEGGPNYYVVRRHRVGPGLISAVRRMLSDGALTTTKAGKVLGVKPTAVDRLVGDSRAA